MGDFRASKFEKGVLADKDDRKFEGHQIRLKSNELFLKIRDS